MLFLLMFLLFLIVSAAACLLWFHFVTRSKAQEIRGSFPPLGERIKVNGQDIHFVDTQRGTTGEADTLAVVFLHGASGNLRDPLHVFKDRLSDTARLIFMDRPGHGWSTRSAAMNKPDRQAKQVIGLLDTLGVERALFVGHSWSGTLIAALALHYPDRVAGLLFNSPVSHPWPGGVNWYYPVAGHPLVGKFFCNTLTLPIGLRMIECATDRVFWPNPVPDYYWTDVGNNMVLTPKRFHANARDIADLRSFVVEQSKHYSKIKAPTTIITGDKDQVVLPWVHSEGLARDIPHARLIWLKDAGHMPHHHFTDVFENEIRELIKKARSPQLTAAE